jgi:hypothetical protein
MSKIQSFQAASTAYTKQQDCNISRNKQVSFEVLTDQLQTSICFGETRVQRDIKRKLCGEFVACSLPITGSSLSFCLPSGVLHCAINTAVGCYDHKDMSFILFL